jgi:mannose-6-phosphate isomerase-like protein (cupin superfamily)
VYWFGIKLGFFYDIYLLNCLISKPMNRMQPKGTVFAELKTELLEQGFTIVQEDTERPWGGFFVIDEGQAQAFANTYFEGLDVNDLKISGKLSPKILLVAPGTRLSWQYHRRRAEIWCLVRGTAGVCTSFTDVEGPVKTLSVGERITLQQGERHRLIGLDTWGIVAEIWQHTDATHPSDEGDIVRVQDDFGR